MHADLSLPLPAHPLAPRERACAQATNSFISVISSTSEKRFYKAIVGGLWNLLSKTYSRDSI